MKNLVILAGGKSSRMGRDKVMLEINGKTFIEHLVHKASGYFDKIIISTDSDAHAEKIVALPMFQAAEKTDVLSFDLKFEDHNVKVQLVKDKYDATGPMGGILSVFEQTDAERFSIISVDVPHAHMGVLSNIYESVEHCACFLQMEGEKPEPLIAAYDRRGYQDIKTAFENGLFKMRMALPKEEIDIYKEEQLRKISGFEDIDLKKIFRNFNTQEELQKLYE